MRFLPGHWALGLQKLGQMRFPRRACLCRANVPGPFSAVGAAFGRLQAFPLQGGRWPEGPDEGGVLKVYTPGKRQRAGLGPAPTKWRKHVGMSVGTGVLTRPRGGS